LRAVIQRVNRKLRADDERLCKARSNRWRPELGDYFIMNFNRNWIAGTHINPELFARELGVLEAWEKVVAE
jgi:hypothetical protein